ncbi:acetyl-CoA synthetase-like protein [Aureobasidium sp. EXF-10727]|nr:acetyl-CoA synthetase-like protein [Aureobasidium sp. EXF-10727]
MVYYPNEYRDVPPVDLLSWIFENNSVNPEKDILIDAADHKNRLNTRQAVSLIRKLVAGFRAAGLEPGDVVCVHAFNHILYPILYYGIIGAGGVFVGSNPAYKTLELNHLLSITEPKFLVVEADLLECALPVIEASIPAARTLIFSTKTGEPRPNDLKCWSSLLQHGEHDWIRVNDKDTAKSTIATLQSTSGTTGLPKVAATSHYALVAAGVNARCSTQTSYAVSRLISLPLFHSFGASFVQSSAFRYGEPTYIMRRFSAEDFISILDRFSITDIAVVPTMMNNIFNQRTSTLSLKNLRRVWCAGASLSPKVSKATYKLLHEDAVICQVWGMTEFGRITSSECCEKDDDGSVGRLLPNTEARVVDRQGFEVLDEEYQGELQVRGPSVMNGYSRCPTGTAEAFSDSWLKTGDFGYIKSGKVYIVGRVKELIKVRGWQVSPNEIEDVLLMHPLIIDAAVIGFRPFGRNSEEELPRAYVVTNGRHLTGLDEVEVMEHVKDRLASFKALDGGVEFVDSIPRNHNGKIMRHQLLERAMLGAAANTIEAKI